MVLIYLDDLYTFRKINRGRQETPRSKWRLLAGKIIHKFRIVQQAMFDYRRVRYTPGYGFVGVQVDKRRLQKAVEVSWIFFSTFHIYVSFHSIYFSSYSFHFLMALMFFMFFFYIPYLRLAQKRNMSSALGRC